MSESASRTALSLSHRDLLLQESEAMAWRPFPLSLSQLMATGTFCFLSTALTTFILTPKPLHVSSSALYVSGTWYNRHDFI